MDVKRKSFLYTEKKIRVFLVFFCLFLSISCKKEIENPQHRIDYTTGQKAYRISFEGTENFDSYFIRLNGSTSSILGKYFKDGDRIIFQPVIPFSWEQDYEIYKDGALYIEFTVRAPESVIRPKLLGIYPKLDTLPENLLKMYFEFDMPMQQSQSSLNFIKVFDQTTGEEVTVFLPLENELWNREKTRLTLWLDPGRIKKDLIPNREKGIPIVKGHQYDVVVKSNFSGGEYQANLDKTYVKSFHVTQRDTKSPSIDEWKLQIPKSNSTEGLKIVFDEPLDILLAQEMIEVVDDRHTAILGSYQLNDQPNEIVFLPENPWRKGAYNIIVNAKLEDLAGNNLNRLFDVDLENNSEVDNSKTKKLSFKID